MTVNFKKTVKILKRSTFGLFVASGVPAPHLCSVSVTRYSWKHTLKIVKMFFCLFVFEPLTFINEPPVRDRLLLKAEKKDLWLWIQDYIPRFPYPRHSMSYIYRKSWSLRNL